MRGRKSKKVWKTEHEQNKPNEHARKQPGGEDLSNPPPPVIPLHPTWGGGAGRRKEKTRTIPPNIVIQVAFNARTRNIRTLQSVRAILPIPPL